MAIDTLKNILPKWVLWKKNAVQLFAGSAYPLPEGEPKFVGSLIQRFNIRKGRAAKPYRDNIGEIKIKISEDFFGKLSEVGMTLNPEQYKEDFIKKDYCLDEIPDFQGLLPKSYRAGVPIFELSDAEIGETGPVLAQLSNNRDRFKRQFEELTNKLTELLIYA